MIPIALDPAALALGLCGRGPAALRRLERLRAAGATPAVFSDDPALTPAIAATPAAADLAGLHVLWIAGLPDAEAVPIAEAARAARVIVNVEDRLPWCDFHNMAEVRRGDLLLTVSTGGAAPGVASRLRARLEAEFGPEWAERLARLKAKRGRWRQLPLPPGEVGRLTEAAIRAKGWFR